MSGNSTNNSKAATPSEGVTASANTNALKGDEVPSESSGPPPVPNNTSGKKDTESALKELEAALVTIEEAIDTKECSDISSMITTEVLPKAEDVQTKINDGLMKNSDTDAIKGKLSGIITSVREKCMKSKSRNTRKAGPANTSSTTTRKNAAANSGKAAANSGKAAQTTTGKNGTKWEYGYLAVTKVNKLTPLYTDYLANKQGTETFGQYLQRSYVPKVPMKGGLWKKNGSSSTTATTTNAAPKKSFFSRKNQPKEEIAGELLKQFKIFLGSKYVKGLALPTEPTFAEYIDDRYTPKLAAMKIETPALTTPVEAVATPAEETVPKIDVPEVDSYWTIDNLSQDKSIGFKAIVQIKKVTEKEISYVITDVIESGTAKEVKVGETRDIFATSWKDLKKRLSGGPTQDTSNLPKKAEEILPAVGSIWELDRTEDTMASPEKKYKAKITITAADQTTIQYGITMMKKSGSAPLGMKEDTMPFTKWAQLLRDKKVTPGSASGGRRTRKQKRKVSKRKTRSRRRM